MTESKKDAFAKMYGRRADFVIVDDPGPGESWNWDPDLVKKIMTSGKRFREATLPIANFFSQMQFASEWRRQEHKRLTEAGWQWDGADGYSEPARTPTGRSVRPPEIMRLPTTQPVAGDTLTSSYGLEPPEIDYSSIERRIAAYFQLGWDGHYASK